MPLMSDTNVSEFDDSQIDAVDDLVSDETNLDSATDELVDDNVDDQTDGETSDEDDQGDVQQDEPQAKKGGFEKRIDKLTKQKSEAAREAAYWKKVALEQQASHQTAEKLQPVPVIPKPQAAHYGSDIERYV